jgi:hypothetical protein
MKSTTIRRVGGHLLKGSSVNDVTVFEGGMNCFVTIVPSNKKRNDGEGVENGPKLRDVIN